MSERDDPPSRAARPALARLIAYALPAAPINAVDTPISIYLPAFYAATGAMSLSLIGALILAARIAEIPISLAAGAVSDAVGPAGRRRRFWLALATPLAMLGIWRLFEPPATPGPVYLLGWLLVVIVGGVLLYLNHIAWGSETATGYGERTRIQALRQAASVAGLLLVLAPPILIERAHPPDLERARMAAIAGFFLILLPACVGLALAFAPERSPATTAHSTGRATLTELLRALAGNRSLTRMLLVDLLDAGSIGVVTSLFVFLSRDVWRLGGLTSLLLLAYLSCGLLGMGPVLRAVRGQRKPRAAAWIAIAISAVLPGLALVPPGGAGFAFAVVLLLGLPSAANTAL
ncbi:MAG: MFS transporter, partial [Proteobacteria bacterium]|nr:MFS transporter [Pseudomonadota bacterium]